MPERIQLRRTKGWRKPEGAVVVSRPSRWGNPFAIECAYDGAWEVVNGRALLGRFATKEAAALEAVARFARAVQFGWGIVPWPGEIREHLAGRDLACWCRLDQPCHADVLLSLANGDTP